MKILVKAPSKGRPQQLIKSISKAMALATNNRDISYMLTLDTNDHSTNNESFDKVIQKLIDTGINITVNRGTSSGKIHACNRDMSIATPGWDIVVLLSDDMVCEMNGWDDIIRQEMYEHYPDTDGLLFFNDGFVGDKLNTFTIMGRKYFDRFNYLYHPSYKSLWSDNELTEVGYILKKQFYDKRVLFKHMHPANTSEAVNDMLYRINDRHYREDEKVYLKRKSNNFGL